jgi:hypothetical protein
MAKTTIPVELSSTPGITDNSNATAITIDSSENVGIGKTPSAANLDIASTGNGLQLSRSGYDTYALQHSTGNGMAIYNVSDSRNEMHFFGDGKIGIGTALPQSGIHIAEGGSGTDGGSVLTLSFTGFGSIVNNDDLGSIHFGGVTGGGVGIHNAAKIMVEGDGTWASNDYPTRLTFHTTADGASSATEHMRITSTGQIQTTSLGVSTPTFSFNNDTNTGMTRPTSDTLQLVCGGTAIVRVDSSDTMFGKASNDINTAGFHIISAGTYAGSCYSGITSAVASSTYHVRDTTNNTWEFYVSNAGVISATSTSITSLSDERLKENIKDLETGLDEVMALKPRRFDWKDRKEKNVAGFIAQEVEPVLPDLIGDYMHDDLDDAKSVKMGDMIPTLVKAIQELKAEIEELKK